MLYTYFAWGTSIKEMHRLVEVRLHQSQVRSDLVLTLVERDSPPVPDDEAFKEIFEQAEI